MITNISAPAKIWSVDKQLDINVPVPLVMIKYLHQGIDAQVWTVAELTCK
jgi:hypothetical protein